MKPIKLVILQLLLCVPHINGIAQERDTLKLSIHRIEKAPADTVYVYSSRVDTIALQPVITDTSKVVKDINPQDLEESKYKVKLMGSVRVNSYYDFKGMPNREGFLPYDIPVGEQTIDNLASVYIGARQSRIGIEGSGNTKVGTIKTYMEVDFASSTSSFWRLRHAFVEWNYFKLGYTWSTFMDNASLPNTVDFEGPNSALVKRHGVIRFEKKFGEKSIFGIALEAPETDYYNPADSLVPDLNKQSNFDIVSRYKLLHQKGHVQLAGIFRRIDYVEKSQMSLMYGWGLMLSSAMDLNIKHSIYIQYSLGDGIANYYVGFAGRGLDAIYNPASEKMNLRSIQGGFFSYNYKFSAWLNFSITYGLSHIDLYEFEPEDAFKSSQYLAINAFYKPIETINIGLELTRGKRVNKDNQSGNAARISLLARFDF